MFPRMVLSGDAMRLVLFISTRGLALCISVDETLTDNEHEDYT